MVGEIFFHSNYYNDGGKVDAFSRHQALSACLHVICANVICQLMMKQNHASWICYDTQSLEGLMIRTGYSWIV